MTCPFLESHQATRLFFVGESDFHFFALGEKAKKVMIDCKVYIAKPQTLNSTLSCRKNSRFIVHFGHTKDPHKSQKCMNRRRKASEKMKLAENGIEP